MKKDRVFDVVVVGAGITGLTAAYLLKQNGKKVAVVEQSDIACGESGHTTAHITQMVDARYDKIISKFGVEGARLVAGSSLAAIEQIASWVERFSISCGFSRVPGYLYTENKESLSELRKELKASRKVGIEARWTESVPLPFHTYGGLMVEGQAQFHPRKYLLELAKHVVGSEAGGGRGSGCEIFSHTHVVEVSEGEPCKVVTSHGTIKADHVIIATNSSISDKVVIHTKVAAYRTYALGLRLKTNTIPDGLYWDTADPYHYTRKYQDLWIIGGEDHKTGMKEDTDESFRNLMAYVQSHFEIQSNPFRWSGQIMEPVDGLPFIGPDLFSQKIFIATGYSGTGITFGTVAGMVISDLILARETPLAELFRPSRIKPISSIVNFVLENKDFPIQLVKDHIFDRISEPELTTLREIKKGEGRSVRIQNQKLAVYRDAAGKLHSISAVCTHLGCHVKWNNSEKSWDCPCHGSRFDIHGTVINGPSTINLKPVTLVERGELDIEKEKKKAA